MTAYLDSRAFLAALPIAFEELALEGNLINRERADRIKEVAQHYAPVAQGAVPAGETPGELRDNIEVTQRVENGKPYIEVGVDSSKVPYANYAHWGTSRMKGFPFMLIAIAQET